jgi:hypothetical protein
MPGAVAIGRLWLAMLAVLSLLGGPAMAFDLFARHEVTAQFATPEGKPMADAEVRVYGPGDPKKVVATGHTDAAGKFTFPADRDGFWTAEAETARQVARVTIRVGGEAAHKGRVPPLVVFGGLALLVALALWYRLLRARNARPPR